MSFVRHGALILLVLNMTACANMNNATTGAITGGVTGGVVGALAGNVACSSSTCRDLLVVGGIAVGALLGYKAGYEKDLELARTLEAELRQQGYQPVLKTSEVEVMVPVDKRTGLEVNNSQLVQVPEVYRGAKKKKITTLKTLTVKMKKPGDEAEAVALSKSFLSGLRNGSERPKLISMPVVDDEQLAIAKRYNISVKRNLKNNGSAILSYNS